MRIRLSTVWMLFTIVLSTNLAWAQNPRTVRWQAGNADSRQFVRNKFVNKEITVDGLVVTAGIVDGFAVKLSINNGSQETISIVPEQIKLEMLQPQVKSLVYRSAKEIASSIELDAFVRASSTEASGALATKTETETTTEYEYSSTDPCAPPQLVTKTITRTVPDECARSRAHSEAMSIRQWGDSYSRAVLSEALRTTDLAANTSIVGVVHFRRDDTIKEVLLRIPLGDLIVEIPFNAVKPKKRFLFFFPKYSFIKFE
ncbi:MAG: hypothetical protein AB1489_29535 [Acidobacteriota bacterium]